MPNLKLDQSNKLIITNSNIKINVLLLIMHNSKETGYYHYTDKRQRMVPSGQNRNSVAKYES